MPGERNRLVAHMEAGDFYGSERSHTVAAAGSVKIALHTTDGREVVLKEKTKVSAGEIIDAAVMSSAALAGFIDAQIQDAKDSGVLLSLHLKATMMKVSDPIMFGIVVKRFYAPVLEKHGKALASAGYPVR